MPRASTRLLCHTSGGSNDVVAMNPPMARPIVAALMAASLFGCSIPPYSARIVDSRGESLPTKTTREGRVIVLGKPGQLYGIHLENGTTQPVAAVISIDGLDVATGAITDFTPERRASRSSYGLEPRTNTVIDGFTVSRTIESTFRLADATQSVAAHVGSPESIGTIEVGFYDAVPFDASVSSADPHFASTRTPPKPLLPVPDAESASSPAEPAPPAVFGELRASHRDDGVRFVLDRSASSRELRRFAFSIRSAAGERLGTVGPPATATAPAVATTTESEDESTSDLPPMEEEDGNVAPVAKPPKGKPVKGASAPEAQPTKPIKPTTKPTKNPPAPETTKPTKNPPAPERKKPSTPPLDK